MEYSLVMYVDHDNEPAGLLEMYTDVGPMVPIFSDQAALAIATTWASNTARAGMRVAVATMDVASPADLVATFADRGTDEDWLARVTFVTDGDEGFYQMLAFMREQNAALAADAGASAHPRRP